MEFLVDNSLINPLSVPELELLYSKRFAATRDRIQSESNSPEAVSPDGSSDDTTLLEESDAKRLAKVLEAPELAVEVERAVVQVRRMLKEKKRVQETI